MNGTVNVKPASTEVTVNFTSSFTILFGISKKPADGAFTFFSGRLYGSWLDVCGGTSVVPDVSHGTP